MDTGEPPKAHGFASPTFVGFALSRMKGVWNPSTTLPSVPDRTAKTGAEPRGIASFLRLYSLSGLPESHAACNLPLFVATATILPTGNLFEV
jgi:hypothetical protein